MPNGALKCKEGMDKIEAEMRPDFRRKVGCTACETCLSLCPELLQVQQCVLYMS